MRSERGFTLTEIAVVFTIVSLLLAGAMYTLSAQTESRNIAETQRRLEEAKDLLISFAVINGRLPCPATAASFIGTADPGATSSYGDEAPVGGGACTGYLSSNTASPPTGFLPARAIGFRPVDAYGYALDAWGNRIRYAVANYTANATTLVTFAGPAAFTTAGTMKTNGISYVPQDLVICSAAQNTAAGTTGTTAPSCGTYGTTGDARAVTNRGTVAAVVFSTGKNTVPATGGADEAENVDGDGVFVWHDFRPLQATGGEYDDQLVWLPVGTLYDRLISAGVLP